MAKLRTADSEMRDGIQVEWMDAETIDLTGPKTFRTPDRTHLRKADPYDMLLNSTLRWAANLPREVMPRALMEKFPRLANLVAANSKESLSFHLCLDSLLVDRRGGRQGLSAEVLEELARLRKFYHFGEYRRKSGASESPERILKMASRAE